MNIFDMIGPVMIGPSSSHTAGAARLGYMARKLLGDRPVRAEITLYGSFAKTYRGHGTDRALIAGILGMKPDDDQLGDSFETARKRGLIWLFHTEESIPTSARNHPNTVKIFLQGETKDGREPNHINMIGSSIGGGSITISSISEMNVNISGQYDCLVVIHNDMPGTIAAVTEAIGRNGINICNISLSRQKKGGLACMTIEVDGTIAAHVPDGLKHIPNVVTVTHLSL